MPNHLENLNAVLQFWQRNMKVPFDRDMPSRDISNVVSAIFNSGNHYFFILDFFDFGIEYVHPSVKEILGCDPETFSFEHIFSIMHPDDAAQIQLKEGAALEFFYNRIPREKIPYYKSSYTFRVQDGKDGWKTILHQSIAIQVREDGRIHRVLSVHTDVSFLGVLPDHRISFIGIENNPSYYALSTDPATLLEPEPPLDISKREKDIVLLLAEGLSSKQIAERLGIAKNTVDTHRRNLLRKTGAKNTLELAIRLMQEGRM